MAVSPLRFAEDMARLATGAVGSVVGLRDEVDAQARQRMERALARFDLVTREEFDAVSEMARRSREEVEILTNRVAELEAKLAAKAPAPAKKPAAKRPATRSATARKAPAKKT